MSQHYLSSRCNGMKQLGVALLSGGVLCLTSPTQAALSETDFLADLPVVLTVSKMVQPLQDSPSSVTIIDQEMIRASGYRDIPDLMRLVPGFSVSYTRDNRFALAYHGLADAYSRRFQVLVDGRSIYSPNFGEVDWGTLPLAIEDIERIEVVRGPNAAVYGTNAFFAIINIISKDSSQTRGTLVSLQAGDQNTAGAVLRYGGGEGDLRYRLTLSSQHRDRHERDFDDPILPVVGDEKLYERTYTRFLNGRWDYQLSNTDEISAQIGLTGGNWNGGGEGRPEENSSYDPVSGFAQLRFNRTLNADEGWNVQFSHNYETRGKDSFVGPFVVKKVFIGDVLYSNNLKQWRTQLDFSSAHRLNSDLRVVWGGELRHEAVQSEGYYGTEETLDGVTAGVFAHAEWRNGEKWLVQGGANLSHHYFTGASLSPRLAVNYHLNPQNTLRFAASQATRSPTFFEVKGNRTLTILGVPSYEVLLTVPADLKPEVNTSVEIGYVGQWPEWGGQLDMRLYRDHITDYIGDRSTSVVYPHGGGSYTLKYFKHYNAGTVDVTGLDMHLVWKPHRDFSLHLGQAFINIDADEEALDVDNDLPESGPDWISSALANWHIGNGLSLSTAIYHTDKMYWLRDGDLTQAYTRMDVRLAKQFKLSGMNAEWAVGVQNIGDDYEEFRRQNLFSRRAYGTLEFSW